ncbi:MAG: hypothetical protein ACOX66_06520 [Oscillospiraceae bacterium]|jgi:hypothetical protein
MLNLNRNNTHVRRTPVTTDLLLNPHLSNDAKAAAAILYACDDSQWSLAEMAAELHTTEEKLSEIYSVLNEWGYLDIHFEDGMSVLTLL